MQKLKEILITLVVSLEFLVLMGFFLFFVEDRIQPIAASLSDAPDILKHVALLPSAMLIWVFQENRKLLFSNENKDATLQKWPDYWKLKVHLDVGLFYAFVFAAIGLFVWMLGYQANEPKGLIPLSISVLGGLVVVLSTYFAGIKIQELLLTAK